MRIDFARRQEGGAHLFMACRSQTIRGACLPILEKTTAAGRDNRRRLAHAIRTYRAGGDRISYLRVEGQEGRAPVGLVLVLEPTAIEIVQVAA